jgi:hypothetical protein
MNHETDTPRTETYVLNPHPQAVPAEFARQLERELAASKAEVERMREQLYECLSYVSHDPIGASTSTAKQLQKGIIATLNPTNK